LKGSGSQPHPKYLRIAAFAAGWQGPQPQPTFQQLKHLGKPWEKLEVMAKQDGVSDAAEIANRTHIDVERLSVLKGPYCQHWHAGADTVNHAMRGLKATRRFALGLQHLQLVADRSQDIRVALGLACGHHDI